MNTKLLSSNVKPSGLNFLENFPPDFSPYSKKTFPPPPVNIFHAHKKHKEDHKSLLDMINPFECESDYEDDEGDDYRDYSSSNLFKRRKFLKYKLYKLKKKKKKKKIVLMKILFGILVFIAVKALLEKFAYSMPTFFTSGRDELYHDGEHVFKRGGTTLSRENSEKLEHRMV